MSDPQKRATGNRQLGADRIMLDACGPTANAAAALPVPFPVPVRRLEFLTSSSYEFC